MMCTPLFGTGSGVKGELIQTEVFGPIEGLRGARFCQE